MEGDVIKFWEIKSGKAQVDVYAFTLSGPACYIAIDNAAGSLALAQELEKAENDHRREIVRFRDNHSVVGNEYPRARAVVEYLLGNKLIAVDEAEYVGPEYDDTIPARPDELIF